MILFPIIPVSKTELSGMSSDLSRTTFESERNNLVKDRKIKRISGSGNTMYIRIR